MLFAYPAAMAIFLLQEDPTTVPIPSESISNTGAPVLASAEEEKQDAEVIATSQIVVTDKTHPEYVRCRSQPVIGSLAKRTKTCMTNRQWEAASRLGNRGARDIVESQQVGLSGQ